MAADISFWLTEPTGDGFTRGFNRVTYLFWGQAFALFVSIASWLSVSRRRAHLTPGMVFFGRVPLLVMIGEAGVLTGLVVLAMLTVPA